MAEGKIPGDCPVPQFPYRHLKTANLNSRLSSLIYWFKRKSCRDLLIANSVGRVGLLEGLNLLEKPITSFSSH